MPWFPDFVGAVELARQQARAAGRADPVGRYVAALTRNDARALEDVWPGEVVVQDPRAGEIRGHRQLRRFVRDSTARLARRRTRTSVVASFRAGTRAVVELLAFLDGDGDGAEVAWPVAVVAECPDDRSVMFRTYCSQRPVDGRAHVRPPILPAATVHPGDVIGRYQSALAAGDTEAVVGTFASDGYLREPIGPRAVHRGSVELHAFFRRCFSTGGVALEHCAVTDDGVCCALEYNCVRWGAHDVPPQAGIAVYERGRDGLLASVRVYDDVEGPVDSEIRTR
jgi:hypothetical protein